MTGKRSKKTRIAFSNPTLLMKRPVSEISNLLHHKEEYKITVLTPRKAFGKRENVLHHSGLEDIKIIDYPTISPPLLWDWPIPGPDFLLKAWNVLQENDIIHMWVPMYKSNTIIAIMKTLFFKEKKLILTMDTIPGYSFSMGKLMDMMMKLYYKTFGRLVFSAADKITLYGKSMIPYAKMAGIPEDKIAVTPTGTHTRIKKQTKDIRKELGIKKDETMVLFAGLLVPRKGIDLIIETSSLLKEEKIRFVLVGDGPSREKYEKMAKEKGLGNNIIFAGFRKDMHNFYNQADIFFLPSRGEGLAGVIMEAMSYGIPIISSRIPCTEDLVSDKEGKLCSTEDVICYEDSIRKLAKNMKKRQKMGTKAKKKIKKDYSWKENIKRFEELY